MGACRTCEGHCINRRSAPYAFVSAHRSALEQSTPCRNVPDTLQRPRILLTSCSYPHTFACDSLPPSSVHSPCPTSLSHASTLAAYHTATAAHRRALKPAHFSIRSSSLYTSRPASSSRLHARLQPAIPHTSPRPSATHATARCSQLHPTSRLAPLQLTRRPGGRPPPPPPPAPPGSVAAARRGPAWRCTPHRTSRGRAPARSGSSSISNNGSSSSGSCSSRSSSRAAEQQQQEQ